MLRLEHFELEVIVRVYGVGTVSGFKGVVGIHSIDSLGGPVLGRGFCVQMCALIRKRTGLSRSLVW